MWLLESGSSRATNIIYIYALVKISPNDRVLDRSQSSDRSRRSIVACVEIASAIGSHAINFALTA